ncbi:MAG: hypothetical protein HPY53_16965 [Brevinematales bacterium]|nr:hypothetical protein [Brevinematales bacterium]
MKKALIIIILISLLIPVYSFSDEIEDMINELSELYQDNRYEEMIDIIDQIKKYISLKNQENLPETINISAMDLFNDYNDNEKKANNNYLNKTLNVFGSIKEIGDDNIIFVVNNYGEFKIGWVTCYFSKLDSEILAELNKGDYNSPS